MITVRCPRTGCHMHTDVSEVFIGRRVRCRKCGTEFEVKKPPPAPKTPKVEPSPVEVPIPQVEPQVVAAVEAPEPELIVEETPVVLEETEETASIEIVDDLPIEEPEEPIKSKRSSRKKASALPLDDLPDPPET